MKTHEVMTNTAHRPLKGAVGDHPREIRENYVFFFLQKKGPHVWNHHVPKYYEVRSTWNPQKWGGREGGIKEHDFFFR